ncbi:fungal-specific transcription factor domain-containing protein [Xylariales sp. PMI_506]|nr:fungal-specific transcription factor domain-containing protein [Xylariales sp. PMI_506]
MPRKTTGCWTCRARKKKCDDGRPSCASCTFRGITCYGYGIKPHWMDGGILEKDMMDSMKSQTKESYKRRRRCRSSQVFRPRRAQSCEVTGHESSPRSVTTVNHRSPPAEAESYGTLSTPEPVESRSPKARDASEGSFPYSETELSLLMYYFDHIFPRLCPFFTYSAYDNGRGWLLSLFLRTKPLCAAAVCLSACDQAQFVLGPLSDIPQPNHDLEMQHIQIVVDLRAHLSQLSLKTGASRMSAAVEALACIMHLILFELWIPRTGLTNDWVIHLDAAGALLSSLDSALSSENAANSPISISSGASVADGVASIFPVDYLSEYEKSAFEFFLTQYTYCFVNSAVTLGLTMQSAQSVARTRSMYHKGQSKLRDMLGCEDWVMNTMLDIAVLKEWKYQRQLSGTLSLRELAHRSGTIESRLSEGLAAMTTSPASIQELPVSATEEQKRIITNIFMNASLLYLHIVVSGFYPNLPEIRHGVLQTLEALEYMRKHSTINIPSWPLCVSGCLALESEYPRFRALSPPHKTGQHPLVLTKWTLDIIEECWKSRSAQAEGEETCDWVTAMNRLGTRLLLL